ncbi:apolipoprotein N-acyltransferase [Candidatus Sumerlaeota bacterium]|nr:apolipoprotein N-acyltransferase [Candidatus Sumerlaeota bacterium]
MSRIGELARRPLLSRAQWRALARPLAVCAGSGLLWRFAYPPFEWSWIAWFALAPFLAVLRNRTPKEGAWLGLCFGFFFFYPNLTWLNTLSDVNPLAPLGIVAVALICALFTVLFGAAAAAALSLAPRLGFLLVPALWTAQEYLRSLGELGFPWIYLGHTQANRIVLIQLCDLTGVYGVSFLTALVNQALADTWLVARSTPRTWGRAGAEWGFALLLLGAAILYGVVELRSASQASDSATAAPVRVLLVQPGVPQSVKLASYADPDPAVRDRMQTRMKEGLKTLLERARSDRRARGEAAPDLCVLPESAITHPYFNIAESERSLAMELQEIAGCPLFFGANRFEPPAGTAEIDIEALERGKMYNSAYLVDSSGIRAETYDKIHLVPFGEYASYFDVIPGFTEYILGIGSFAPGRTFRTFSIASGHFGAVVCFESCFPYLFRRFDRKGVDWMMVITNDAWYKTSSGARRHQIQSVFRAVEMRRPMVRVANTGISCVIDPWGRTSCVLALREGEGKYGVASVPNRRAAFDDSHTVYMRAWGEWFSWLCLVVSVVSVVYCVLARGNEKPSSARPPRRARR